MRDSNDFAEYHDQRSVPSEYTKYRGYASVPDQGDYAHPEYYQAPVAPEQKAAPAPQYDPYAEYAGPVPTDPYAQQGQKVYEYRGPQHMEGYTSDPGEAQREAVRQQSEGTTKRKGLAGLGGGAVAIGAFLLKLKSLAFLLKFGTASFSILISVGVYAIFYGWPFAIGIVTLIFIHEMGHALAMKLKGIPVGGLIFIPMFGAAVSMKQMPQNAKDEAEVGIAGPIAGTLAASFCLFLAQMHTGGSIWAPLAYFGFFINLFNLIPIVPFDGGRVLAAIDRRVWLLGFVGLLGFQIWQWFNGSFSIWLLLFVLMAGAQLWSRGFAPSTPESQQYYNVSTSARIALTVLYFGLILVLVLGMTMSHELMPIPR